MKHSVKLKPFDLLTNLVSHAGVSTPHFFQPLEVGKSIKSGCSDPSQCGDADVTGLRCLPTDVQMTPKKDANGCLLEILSSKMQVFSRFF